ncbi:Atu4866 domain-containing protein [Halomonas sp. ML-15]|nr:Atu4866 domain-containing protein [Halomonas sp. ML-15]
MSIATTPRKSTLFALAMLAALPLLGWAATATGDADMADHPYVGMWVTDDGYIRHELLPNNRYDEARGERESAYQGRYRVTGHYIEYWDDTGFTADGEFIDGVLYHAGMVLRRKE